MTELEGVVEEIVFANAQSGFAVLTLRAEGEEITCVGGLAPAMPGERLHLTGEWTQHRDYGRQFRADGFETMRPDTKDGVERYLGSGAIRGIGPATAKQIVSRFGKDALEILDESPERLLEIPGIGPKKARMIQESYRDERVNRQALAFLQGFGVGPATAASIVRTLGEDTISIVRADPYMLAERVEGVGFKTADAIAHSLGIEKDSPHRLVCGLRYVVDEAAHAGGHTCLPEAALMRRAGELLGAGGERLENALTSAIVDGRMTRKDFGDGPLIYATPLFEAEGEVASRVRRLLGRGGVDPERAQKRLSACEKESGLTLDTQQREAVLKAATGGITLITGGPGTGKTTCIRTLLALAGEGAVLCAPTGRAAKRMQEATGEDAKTIHRLLEYAGDAERFSRDENNPIDAELVIVDEASMIDLFLMRALLRALPPKARLVLVGDKDQLPSVGAGNVLGDLIASGVPPVVFLTEIYRQAQKSMIVVGAHRINHGEMPVLNGPDTDFFFQRAETPEQAAQVIAALVKTRLPKYLGVDALRGIQVLSPMKKGEAGVWALNRLLQDTLNPAAPRKAETRFGEGVLREGDKVMQMRNNYDLEWTRDGETGTGAFNGDIGFVTDIDDEAGTTEVTFDDERVALYEEAGLADLELAYCVSVHKSQGSEFDAVVLPLTGGPPMLLTRNLLYTAVTRARRLAVIVGRERCIRQMVENDHVALRYSALAQRLSP